jgi:hypothetical protein
MLQVQLRRLPAPQRRRPLHRIIRYPGLRSTILTLEFTWDGFTGLAIWFDITLESRRNRRYHHLDHRVLAPLILRSARAQAQPSCRRARGAYGLITNKIAEVSTAFVQGARSVSDLVKSALPIAVHRLPEEAGSGIERAVLSGGKPAPIGDAPQCDECGPA